MPVETYQEVLFPYIPIPKKGFRRPNQAILRDNQKRWEKYIKLYPFEIITNHQVVEPKIRIQTFQAGHYMDFACLMDFACVPLSNGRHWMFQTKEHMEEFREYALKAMNG